LVGLYPYRSGKSKKRNLFELKQKINICQNSAQERINPAESVAPSGSAYTLIGQATRKKEKQWLFRHCF
jgi:hypothetical protein